MPYIIWLIIASLITWSIFDPKFPWWIALIVYFAVVIIKLIEKGGNYSDWTKMNERDEKLKLEETLNDLASRNIINGGTRIKAERKIKEDFLYERKRERRKFWVEIISTFSLK